MMEAGGRRDEHGRAVRAMFASIADRYDLLNHLLSGNIDRLWRRRCVAEVRRRMRSPAPRILDVGCGTGDLTLAFASLGDVVGCDFCHPMLVRGGAKVARSGLGRRIALVEGDALRLPFDEERFDAVVSAFVVRNLANLEAGLKEMRRVLRRGGLLAVLDFAMPAGPIFGMLYRLYFTRVLPRVGRLLSGVDGPYRYLPESVRTFPPPLELRGRIEGAGFARGDCLLLTGGVAALHLAVRHDP